MGVTHWQNASVAYQQIDHFRRRLLPDSNLRTLSGDFLSKGPGTGEPLKLTVYD
jgi:hypothetical protein